MPNFGISSLQVEDKSIRMADEVANIWSYGATGAKSFWHVYIGYQMCNSSIATRCRSDHSLASYICDDQAVVCHLSMDYRYRRAKNESKKDWLKAIKYPQLILSFYFRQVLVYSK